MLKVFYRSLLILILVSAFSGVWSTSQAAPVRDDPTPAAPTVLKTDLFGYKLDRAASNSSTFIDANVGGIKLTFSNFDDSFSGPVNLNFPFKFYENTYSTMYVSTNGLITFGRGDADMVNKPVPFDTQPNNFIAPFWDDLGVPATGGVYVLRRGNVVGSRSVVIEWLNVDNILSGQAITFEAILYENGNIAFKYKTLAGNLQLCSVGIEDGEGLDGLEYVYNADGLLDPGNGNAPYDITFTRPDPNPRVKILPRYSSSFIINHKASFQLTLRNSGDLGPDAYELSTVVSDPTKWQATVSNLVDSNSNGLPDTGQIAAGAAISVSLDLKPVDGASPIVGDSVSVILKATSTALTTQFITATLQAAIPTPFAQVYVAADGIHLQQIWDKSAVDWLMDKFTGKTLAVREISADNYLVIWEKRASLDQPYTELEYQIVNRVSGVKSGVAQVLSNSAQQLSATVSESNSETPTLARNSKNQIGVAWTQMLKSGTGGFNTNMYLAILDSTGTRISDRFNLTGDTTFYAGSSDSHRYASHSIIAMDDDRFFVCWLDNVRLSGIAGTNLVCGIYSFDGSQLSTVKQFTVSSVITPNTISLPYLARLSGSKVMLVYNQNSMLAYSVWTSAGDQIPTTPGALSSEVGSNPVAVQFASGDTVMAWKDPTGQIGYAYLDTAYAPKAGYPQLLPKITQRPTAYPSLTLEDGGRAVLTATDDPEVVNNYKNLYYVLLDSSGNIQTPGMSFLSPIINTSTYGFGNAAYRGVFKAMLPVVRKP